MDRLAGVPPEDNRRASLSVSGGLGFGICERGGSQLCAMPVTRPSGVLLLRNLLGNKDCQDYDNLHAYFEP